MLANEKNNKSFKPPLSIAEIIDKLIEIRIIFLKMLENSDYFLLWAEANKLTEAINLCKKLRQHVQAEKSKDKLISAIKNFDQENPATINALQQILKDDSGLRNLIIANQARFRTTLARWEQNPNTFFDDNSDDTTIGVFDLFTSDQDMTAHPFFANYPDKENSCRLSEDDSQQYNLVEEARSIIESEQDDTHVIKTSNSP